MGCDCAKPKPGQPTGRQTPPAAGSNTSNNGGGLAGRTQSFSMTPTTGKSITGFGSMLEASAAAVRAGGGVVRPE